MYYIIYPLLYLLSLLPWRVLYLFSDGVYGLLYYVFKYRRDVVKKNLLIAFPEKSDGERTRIAKDFYHNFTDAFIETIKLLSTSDKEFSKRFTSNIEVLNALYEEHPDVQLMAGHFFNWEFINFGAAKYGKYPFVGVYMPVTNKAFDKIMYDMRSRYGTILVSAVDFKNKFHEMVKSPYAIGLAADQNPGSPLNAHWVNFFGRLTPFVLGPEKGARQDNLPVLFGHFYKTKRGHYHLNFEIVTMTPLAFEPGQLTQLFANHVEKAIRLKPSNYLWSHRRWKFEYDAEKYSHLVVK
jgi:KDO2-lipid IV(A) lauroyltransferase